MKVRMAIVHVQSGHEWVGEQSEISEKELEETKAAIKENLSSLTYVELNDEILPGEFIRHNCTITFYTED